jgi:hypothetical protein
MGECKFLHKRGNETALLSVEDEPTLVELEVRKGVSI